MKILFINAVYGTGSTGRAIKEIDEYCQEIGDEVYIASGGLDIDKSEKFYPIGNIIDHKIHAFLSRLCCKQAGFSSLETYKLIKWIEGVHPDIIQLNNVHSNYINLYMLLRYTAQKDIPVVLVLDDCWFYTGNCCHYTEIDCDRWKSHCGGCQQLHKWNRSYFYDGTKRNLHNKRQVYKINKYMAVIGVSDWIANAARESILKDSYIIRRIYNSLDLSVFKPLKNIEKPNQFIGYKIVLGVATYWDNSKGLHFFNRLAVDLPEDYKIILIGGGEESSFHNTIYHISHTDNLDELVQYYNIADIFVQMSIEESFGKVCAEALACGTPIAVFDSTASPELVGDGCGAIAKKNDYMEMRENIIRICMQGKTKYTDKCVEFAETNFSKKDNLEQYRKVYKDLEKIKNGNIFN